MAERQEFKLSLSRWHKVAERARKLTGEFEDGCQRHIEGWSASVLTAPAKFADASSVEAEVDASVADIQRLLAREFLKGPKVQTAVNAYLINTGSKLVLVDAGAALLLPQAELPPEAVAQVGNYSRGQLLEMAEKARSLARPEAAAEAANVCAEIAK